MLTKNQYELLTYGLNNGAVGTVKDIYYEKGQGPPTMPSFVLVDFPSYKGPHPIPGYPTYIPIVIDSGRCADRCCGRTGIPLMPAYAVTVGKAQGMTIGKDKPLKKCVIKFNDDTRMESLNLGIAYTALSRVCELTDVALSQKIPWERLEVINRHKGMIARKKELVRLQNLEKETLSEHACTIHEYINLIACIDNLSNDGIVDSVCNNTSNHCACLYHKISH